MLDYPNLAAPELPMELRAPGDGGPPQPGQQPEKLDCWFYVLWILLVLSVALHVVTFAAHKPRVPADVEHPDQAPAQHQAAIGK